MRRQESWRKRVCTGLCCGFPSWQAPQKQVLRWGSMRKSFEKVIWRMCSWEKGVRKWQKQNSKGGEIKSHEGQAQPDPGWDSRVPSGRVMLASGGDAGLLYSCISQSLVQGCPRKDQTLLACFSVGTVQGQFSEEKHKGGLCRQKRTEAGPVWWMNQGTWVQKKQAYWSWSMVGTSVSP